MKWSSIPINSNMIDAERFAEYTYTSNSAWSSVERMVLEHAFRRYYCDKFNWLNLKENRSIDAITTKFGSLIPANFSVLDLATGTGRVVEELIDYGVPSENILGIDKNPKMLSDPHFPVGAGKLQGDIAKLNSVLDGTDFADRHFDLVTANMVFHLLPYKDYVQTLKQVRERVTDVAYLYIVVPHPLRVSMDTISKYHRRQRISEVAPWGEQLPYDTKTISDYERGLAEADFDCFSIRTTGVGLKIEDNLLLNDEAVWSRIKSIKGGSAKQKLPNYFRLWLMASA